MNYIIIYFIKAFFAYSSIFIIIVASIDYTLGKLQLLPIILLGVIYGIIMSLTGIFFYVRRLKKIEITDFSNTSIKSHQKKILETKISKEELFKILKNDAKTGRMKLEVKDNLFILDPVMNWTPWKGEVYIQINIMEQDFKQIVIFCDHRFSPLSVWYYGQDLVNVSYIENLIKNSSSMNQ
jgi:hypothetical protein